tara:strand:+ start:258 stop:389 length:132 start_codon:yes stop_codon:yes gene_type:complete
MIPSSVQQRLKQEIFDEYGRFKETCSTKITFYKQKREKAGSKT